MFSRPLWCSHYYFYSMPVNVVVWWLGKVGVERAIVFWCFGEGSALGRPCIPGSQKHGIHISALQRDVITMYSWTSLRYRTCVFFSFCCSSPQAEDSFHHLSLLTILLSFPIRLRPFSFQGDREDESGWILVEAAVVLQPEPPGMFPQCSPWSSCEYFMWFQEKSLKRNVKPPKPVFPRAFILSC